MALTNYKPKTYEPEIMLDYFDAILFYITDGNPAEMLRLNEARTGFIYDIYYMKRVNFLNNLYAQIENYKRLNK